jgi:hypothetical protein
MTAVCLRRTDLLLRLDTVACSGLVFSFTMAAVPFLVRIFPLPYCFAVRIKNPNMHHNARSILSGCGETIHPANQPMQARKSELGKADAGRPTCSYRVRRAGTEAGIEPKDLRDLRGTEALVQTQQRPLLHS